VSLVKAQTCLINWIQHNTVGCVCIITWLFA